MIKIGTRGSKLALWQAHNLQDQLHAIDVETELCIIKTRGDQIQHLSFDKIEGKGFFTKEIEDALIAGDIDVAVHSMKDLPTEMPEGLALAGLSTRANPADILIIRKDVVDTSQPLQLKQGAKVGTSSIRRKVQLKHFAKGIETADIRGNVPTRIQKMVDGQCDAIVLASAGVDRLEIDLSEHHVIRFNPKEFVSAPAQGVVAYQCRTSDKDTRRVIAKIHKAETALCTNVERRILQLMDGGCQLPLGAYCHRDASGNYRCYATYSADPSEPLRRAQLSQSTHIGMADRIVEMLNNPA